MHYNVEREREAQILCCHQVRGDLRTPKHEMFALTLATRNNNVLFIFDLCFHGKANYNKKKLITTGIFFFSFLACSLIIFLAIISHITRQKKGITNGLNGIYYT